VSAAAEPSGVSLRPARQDEFPAIQRMVYAERLNPMGLDWKHFWVALDSAGEIIGCGQLKPHGDGTVELASLVTSAAWRGRGVAGMLVRRLIAEHANQRPGEPLYLTCRGELGPFYQKFGFQRLAFADLPPYFRRIVRIFGAVKVFIPGELWVMRREG
jgi:N-acetylglutamate synthase-like GNAT family acetyltransferase